MNRKCVVGKRIFRNYNFLKLVARLSKQKRTRLLKNATPDQLKSIIEIAANIINYKRFCLNCNEKKDVKKCKKFIQQLADLDCHEKVKKFTQKGSGFWTALLIPVLFEISRTILKNV